LIISLISSCWQALGALLCLGITAFLSCFLVELLLIVFIEDCLVIRANVDLARPQVWLSVFSRKATAS
jgi:hypothetical protein